MEPVAPGTEDDLPMSFASLSKQEKENERLLNLRAFLPNRQYGKIFELQYVNGVENWYCNACECPIMGRVFYHESGKRHKMALGNQNREKTSVVQPEPKIAMHIAPGEPVPPGFEEEVEKVAEIQESLDGFRVGPLVALEYLLELQDYDVTKEPTYLCILCDKKGDPRTVLTHLASYNHIVHYLKTHFPTCYRALAPYMTKQYKRNWQTCLHRVAEAIEKKFGRLKPRPIELNKFEKERVHYLQLVAKERHFNEAPGCTFEEYIIKDELTKSFDDISSAAPSSKAYDDNLPFRKTTLPQSRKSPSPPVVENPIKRIKVGTAKDDSAGGGAMMMTNRRNSLSSVSSISSSDLSDFESSTVKKSPPQQRTMRSPVRKRNRSPSPYSRRNIINPNDFRRREKDLMPWERADYRKSNKTEVIVDRKSIKHRSSDKLDEYRKLCKAIDSDMERILKQHKKNPEKHPQYNDEWKKFWNRRYKELQTEGKDASNYDFKPEWIVFWNNRMIELQQEETKMKKDALKKRLEIFDELAPISFRIAPKSKKVDKDNSSEMSSSKLPLSSLSSTIATTAQSDAADQDVIVIEDKDDDSKSSSSPWEDEPSSKTSTNITAASTSSGKQRVRLSRDRSRERSRHSRELDHYSMSRLERSSHDRDYINKEYLPLSSRDRDYRSRERIRIVDELPSWESDRKLQQHYRKNKELLHDYYKPPAVMRDVTREPVRPLRKKSPLSPGILDNDNNLDDNDGEINVVGVLRLLTALEEKLGSLGPKIIDLLGQALAMEKNEPNSSDTLLDNEVNCVLFETVKEKLKGQLLAGLVEHIQQRAFKNAIKKLASLIHLAGNRKKEQEQRLVQAKCADPVVQVAGVGTVDKAAIARQIANALVLQGKTDVTQDELEQLINAVVGMAEASRTSNKPITTASFLEQMSNKQETENVTTVVMPVKTIAPPSASSVRGGSNDGSLIEQRDQPSTSNKNDNTSTSMEKSFSSSNNNKMNTSDIDEMEVLSDSDLQTLLQNFKDLSTDEQHKLITYLKKLEVCEPDRVERLRKFVTITPTSTATTTINTTSSSTTTSTTTSSKITTSKTIMQKQHHNDESNARQVGRESPFSNRQSSINPSNQFDSVTNNNHNDDDENNSPQNNKIPGNNNNDDDNNDNVGLQNKLRFDSDEEDYSFEDVVKAASNNVKQKELEKEREIVEESMKFESMRESNSNDNDDKDNNTKKFITSIMNSYHQSNNNNNSGEMSTSQTSSSVVVGALNMMKQQQQQQQQQQPRSLLRLNFGGAAVPPSSGFIRYPNPYGNNPNSRFGGGNEQQQPPPLLQQGQPLPQQRGGWVGNNQRPPPASSSSSQGGNYGRYGGGYRNNNNNNSGDNNNRW